MFIAGILDFILGDKGNHWGEAAQKYEHTNMRTIFYFLSFFPPIKSMLKKYSTFQFKKFNRTEKEKKKKKKNYY